jgi:hypothetical protein
MHRRRQCDPGHTTVDDQPKCVACKIVVALHILMPKNLVEGKRYELDFCNVCMLVAEAEGKIFIDNQASCIVQALHKTAAIESVDLANCYDAVAHLIASIALQSFKVHKVMVAMMLYVLETMTWYPKTAFGQCEKSFGGTGWDPSMGLGQGNGASPPGFLAVCTLLINVYPNLVGHGVTFVGA